MKTCGEWAESNPILLSPADPNVTLALPLPVAEKYNRGNLIGRPLRPERALNRLLNLLIVRFRNFLRLDPMR